MGADRHRGYAFGEFVLDLDRCALLRSGRDVGLDPRHVHVLALLVEHPGTPVTRDRILSDVWDKSPSADSALEQSVAALRAALDEGMAEPIRAIGDDAYQFEGKVEPLEELAIPPTLGKRHHREPFAMGLIGLIVLLFLVLWLTDTSGESGRPETPTAVSP